MQTQAAEDERHRKMRSTKQAVEKKSNQAGATPLFRLSAAQKYRGVAPALSRILREPFFPPHTRTHATSQSKQHYTL
jgi:hypothetical protein